MIAGDTFLMQELLQIIISKGKRNKNALPQVAGDKGDCMSCDRGMIVGQPHLPLRLCDCELNQQGKSRGFYVPITARLFLSVSQALTRRRWQ